MQIDHNNKQEEAQNNNHLERHDPLHAKVVVGEHSLVEIATNAQHKLISVVVVDLLLIGPLQHRYGRSELLAEHYLGSG